MLIPLGILASSGGFFAAAGYFAGGSVGGASINTLNKFAFPTDTRTTLSAVLSNSVQQAAGMANAKVAGYVAGGFTGSVTIATVDKFLFADDTRSTLGTGLSSNRRNISGLANSGVAGYTGGGLTTNTGGISNSINKFAFPSDTRTTLTDFFLANSRQSYASFANSGVAGYFAGGTDQAPVDRNTVEKLAFPGDTKTTLGTGLSSVASSFKEGFANSGVAGYVGSGTFSDTRVTTINKFAFPSDTRSTLGTGLSAARSNGTGMADSGVAGYFAGGLQDGGDQTTVDKFAFPSDTRTTLGTGLSSAKRNMAGFASSGVL
jgi:hypothetical protein